MFSIARREFLRLGSTLALSTKMYSSFTQKAQARVKDRRGRPNVIVILTDDQGYGALGLLGNKYLKTPHLDRLGHEGIRFTQH